MDPGTAVRRSVEFDSGASIRTSSLMDYRKSERDAEMSGYTVVELPAVLATHLTEIVKSHAHEILSVRMSAHFWTI